MVAEVDDNQTRACWCDVAPINIEMSQDENGAVNGNATSRTSNQALMLRIELEITLLIRATNDRARWRAREILRISGIRDELRSAIPTKTRGRIELEPTSMSL